MRGVDPLGSPWSMLTDSLASTVGWQALQIHSMPLYAVHCRGPEDAVVGEASGGVLSVWGRARGEVAAVVTPCGPRLGVPHRENNSEIWHGGVWPRDSRSPIFFMISAIW